MLDLTDRLDWIEYPEACVFNDRADTFLLGILVKPCDNGGPLDLFVKTLRPLCLPYEVCSERVSAGTLALEPGRPLGTIMKP